MRTDQLIRAMAADTERARQVGARWLLALLGGPGVGPRLPAPARRPTGPRRGADPAAGAGQAGLSGAAGGGGRRRGAAAGAARVRCFGRLGAGPGRSGDPPGGGGGGHGSNSVAATADPPGGSPLRPGPAPSRPKHRTPGQREPQRHAERLRRPEATGKACLTMTGRCISAAARSGRPPIIGRNAAATTAIGHEQIRARAKPSPAQGTGGIGGHCLDQIVGPHSTCLARGREPLARAVQRDAHRGSVIPVGHSQRCWRPRGRSPGGCAPRAARDGQSPARRRCAPVGSGPDGAGSTSAKSSMDTLHPVPRARKHPQPCSARSHRATAGGPFLAPGLAFLMDRQQRLLHDILDEVGPSPPPARPGDAAEERTSPP